MASPLQFEEMKDEDRASAAADAMAALDARQAAKAAEAGGASAIKSASRRAKVNPGSIGENLRDLDMQGVDTGYDATERARNARRAQTRHSSGRPTGMKSGGSVSASKRADGCAIRGKTKGRIV